MGNHSTLARFGGQCFLLACLSWSALRSQNVMSPAEAAIERFRKGERYQPPPKDFLASGHIVEEALEPFGPALRSEPSPVREEIVRLLADLGKRADPLYPKGGQLIRDPYIISVLVNEGL